MIATPSIYLAVPFYVLVFSSAIAFVIYRNRTKDRRRVELASVASRMGFSFDPAHDETFAVGWGFLSLLSGGHDRYAFNLLKGDYEGHRVTVFDYHHTTGSGKNKREHYLTVFFLVVKEIFPRLVIQPKTLADKVAEAAGFEDINFESAEFSRAFCVKSPDKRFAYDVCNAPMIEFLLANRDLEITVEGPALMLSFGYPLPATEVEFNVRRLREIRSHLPEYLFTKT
jgi:hypothetical protein